MTTAVLADPNAPVTGQAKEAKEVKIDDELRDAVRHVMTTHNTAHRSIAKVQELLDKKAAQMRAPFTEKLRRIKETA